MQHPSHLLLDCLSKVPASLYVTSESVFDSLKTFPKASCPGFFHLRLEHLLEVITDTSAPAASDCLQSLTQWICVALSGQMDS
jgi:hypothetical protein